MPEFRIYRKTGDYVFDGECLALESEADKRLSLFRSKGGHYFLIGEGWVRGSYFYNPDPDETCWLYDTDQPEWLRWHYRKSGFDPLFRRVLDKAHELDDRVPLTSIEIK